MRHHMAQDLAKKRLRVQWQSRAIQAKPRAQDPHYYRKRPLKQV
jgi:hypothetical protein